jgi:hypothetical protein
MEAYDVSLKKEGFIIFLTVILTFQKHGVPPKACKKMSKEDS